VTPFICTMPLRLDQGWNQIQFNLADFCRRAYGTGYVETLRVQLHCSCRVRRVYFSDRLYSEDELPPEFKLYVPLNAQPQQEQQAQPARGVDDDTGHPAGADGGEEEFAASGDAYAEQQPGDDAGMQQYGAEGGGDDGTAHGLDIVAGPAQ
jgi:hypothetical protein